MEAKSIVTGSYILVALTCLLCAGSIIQSKSRGQIDKSSKERVPLNVKGREHRRLGAGETDNVAAIQELAIANRAHQEVIFPYRIIQASPPKTGGTLLANILMGLFDPNGDLCFDNEWFDTDIPCPESPVLKTAKDNIERMEEWILGTKGTEQVFFITSVRDWRTLRGRDCERPNVLCIEHDDFMYKNQEEMEEKIHYVATKIVERFSYFEGSWFNENAAIRRLEKMEQVAEHVKGADSKYWEKKYLLHGHEKGDLKEE